MKRDFRYWMQWHCARLNNKLIKVWLCGVKQKLAMFDTGKAFVDKLVQLSRNLKKWRKKRLRFLIAVTFCYIKKYINFNLFRGVNPKLAMFDTGKLFMDKLVQLSRKAITWRKKRLLYLIAVILCLIKININDFLSLRSETKISKVSLI